MVNKRISPTKKEIKKAVKEYNEQKIRAYIPVFAKIRDIQRYHGVPGLSLKKEAVKNLSFDEMLFHRVFLLEDKICALKHHLSNINKFKQEHKKALIDFANLFSRSSSGQWGSSHLIHSGDKIRYEFEAFQFQFKASLDLLAYVIYYIYGDRRKKGHPFKGLENVLKNNLGSKYLSKDILLILTNEKWVKEFLSDGIQISKRDMAAHYPWELKYDYSEVISRSGSVKYNPIKIGGEELYKYCLRHHEKLVKMVNSILDSIFVIE